MLSIPRIAYTAFRDSYAISFLLQKLHRIPKPFMDILAQAELGRLYTGVLHDLSNPITSLLLYIQTQTNTPHQELVETVASQIKDVLQTARNTQYTNERGAISLTKTIQNAQGLLAYKAMQGGVRIVTFVEQDILLYGKKLSLQQIITNLLSNAIDAYSACTTVPTYPSVTISATRTPQHTQITVHDFGCGIPPEKIKYIFTPFYTTKSTGTGIGLTLVEQLVRHEYGGTLHVTSDKTAGTYFIVRIPLTKNFPRF